MNLHPEVHEALAILRQHEPEMYRECLKIAERQQPRHPVLDDDYPLTWDKQSYDDCPDRRVA